MKRLPSTIADIGIGCDDMVMVDEPTPHALMLRDTVIWLREHLAEVEGETDFDRGYRMGLGLRDIKNSDAGMPNYLGRATVTGTRRAYGYPAANWLGRHRPDLAQENNDNYHCFVWGNSCGGSD